MNNKQRTTNQTQQTYNANGQTKQQQQSTATTTRMHPNNKGTTT
jgi:hypothetical protein